MHFVFKLISTLVLSYVIVTIVHFLGRVEKQRPKPKPKPPGPPPLPFLGNLLQMPRQEEWKTYRQWGKQYGA